MPNYSIKDLERLTGIKAHTIRIWEQRYNLLSPDRSDTNIRTYTNEELKHLLNVSLLNKYGIKISRIAEMKSDQIANEAANLLQKKTDHEDRIFGLIRAMIDLDESLFERVIRDSIKDFGFQEAVLEIIYPFLFRIGIMWQTGTINPAQEHFISNLVRQKFIVAIDSIKQLTPSSSRTYLLFLRENELHELSLLFYHYLVRDSGYKAFYLGQSVPYEDLKRIVAISKADHMISCFTTPQEQTVKDYLSQLSSDFPEMKIYVFGSQVEMENLTSFNNVHIFNGPQELTDHIKLS